MTAWIFDATALQLLDVHLSCLQHIALQVLSCQEHFALSKLSAYNVTQEGDAERGLPLPGPLSMLVSSSLLVCVAALLPAATALTSAAAMLELP